MGPAKRLSPLLPPAINLGPLHEWPLWIFLFLLAVGPTYQASAAFDSPEHLSSEPSSTPSRLTEKGAETTSSAKYNLVFVVSDQLRFDALRFVQDGLSHYDGMLKINTPNIDRLAKMGVVFENTYCQAAVCGASRSSFMTGNTIRRTGVSNNNFMGYKALDAFPVHRERVDRLRTFEQILIDE
jgi:Sulfatase